MCTGLWHSAEKRLSIVLRGKVGTIASLHKIKTEYYRGTVALCRKTIKYRFERKGRNYRKPTQNKN